MERTINDAGYIEYLGNPIRQKQYLKWKARMLPVIESIAGSFKSEGFEATMMRFNLTRRDAVLLKRLSYLMEDEVPPELVALEREMPL